VSAARPAPRPTEFFLQVHVTTACNLRCHHCYLGGAVAPMEVGLFETLLDQFDELTGALGVAHRWVQVTGGEPLLHPRIWELLERVAARCEVRLLTNGTLIGAEAAGRLKETCTAVQVSLDGLPPTHDAWRGDGAFAAALSGLRRLGEAGVTRSVRMTVGRDNVDDVVPLVEFLEGECELFSLSRVVCDGGCGVEPPGREAYRRVVYELYGRRHGAPAIRLSDPCFGPLIATDDPETPYRGCSAGYGGLCVVEDGTVYPCRRLPVPVGRVAAAGPTASPGRAAAGRTLRRLYESAPLLLALRRRRFGKPCGDCEDIAVCGGDRCLALAATGDPLAGDHDCIHIDAEEARS
jgi:AdoMet-dependent heme synthase